MFMEDAFADFKNSLLLALHPHNRYDSPTLRNLTLFCSSLLDAIKLPGNGDYLIILIYLFGSYKDCSKPTDKRLAVPEVCINDTSRQSQYDKSTDHP